MSPTDDLDSEKNLGRMKVEMKTGDEAFNKGKLPLGLSVLDFWQWSCSDLIENTTRGILAEFLVATALGISVKKPREGWAPWDLTANDGTKVEVKSAAFLQVWYQKKHSKVKFGIGRTKAWDPETNKLSEDLDRRSDVYVFALHAHKDQSTIDPLDVSQWEFFILPTALINDRLGGAKSISLSVLKGIHGDPAPYDRITELVTFAKRIGSS